MVALGIPDISREKVAQLLRVLLANEYILATKLNNFHWNVEGVHFGPLHTLFQSQYEATLTVIDDVAERIRALGHYSPGSLKEFLILATLAEESGSQRAAAEMLKLLLLDTEHIIREIRHAADRAQEVGDGGTNNFLLNQIELHEKRAWMIRAHLK